MSEFIDGIGLSFERFVNMADPECVAWSPYSYIKPEVQYSVILKGRVAKEIPADFGLQSFGESYLEPISKNIGVCLLKTAKLIALRNAWVAYFQETEISKRSIDEINSLITKDIATDYVVLTSSKWLEHPLMKKHSTLQKIAEPPIDHDFEEDPDVIACHQAWVDSQEADINFCINEFISQDDGFSSFLEIDADAAKLDIKKAKQRISELKLEINEHEEIIALAMRPIRKLRKHENSFQKQRVGRPQASEAQQQRRGIAKKFVAQWINSLMAALSISSCGELEKTVCGQKMTWWRWLNQESLPSSNFLKPLLDVEIKTGALKGKKLRDIQTSPSLHELMKLLDLV